MPWLVLATTHSPALTGIVAAAETVPYVAAAALGSPLVDRFGARRVSCTADLLSAAPVGAIPFVYRSGFVVLLVLVMMAGTLRGFGDISKRVLLPMAVSQSGMRLIRATVDQSVR